MPIREKIATYVLKASLTASRKGKGKEVGGFIVVKTRDIM